MSKEDLIPFNKMSKEKAREIQSMGGKAVSPQKRFAARLRELRKQGLEDKTIEKLVSLIESPQCSAIDIKMYIGSLKFSELSDHLKIRLIEVMLKWHEAIHGKPKADINILNLDSGGLLSDLKAFLEGKELIDKPIDVTPEISEDLPSKKGV